MVSGALHAPYKLRREDPQLHAFTTVESSVDMPILAPALPELRWRRKLVERRRTKTSTRLRGRKEMFNRIPEAQDRREVASEIRHPGLYHLAVAVFLIRQPRV